MTAPSLSSILYLPANTHPASRYVIGQFRQQTSVRSADKHRILYRALTFYSDFASRLLIASSETLQVSLNWTGLSWYGPTPSLERRICDGTAKQSKYQICSCSGGVVHTQYFEPFFKIWLARGYPACHPAELTMVIGDNTMPPGSRSEQIMYAGRAVSGPFFCAEKAQRWIPFYAMIYANALHPKSRTKKACRLMTNTRWCRNHNSELEGRSPMGPDSSSKRTSS